MTESVQVRVAPSVSLLPKYEQDIGLAREILGAADELILVAQRKRTVLGRAGGNFARRFPTRFQFSRRVCAACGILLDPQAKLVREPYRKYF